MFDFSTRKRSFLKRLAACLTAIVLSCCILTGCGSSVTPESVTQKGQDVFVKLGELARVDPSRALQIAYKVTTTESTLRNPDDLEALDKFYDEILKEINYPFFR